MVPSSANRLPVKTAQEGLDKVPTGAQLARTHRRVIAGLSRRRSRVRARRSRPLLHAALRPIAAVGHGPIRAPQVPIPSRRGLPTAGGPPPFLTTPLLAVIAAEGLDRELERRVDAQVPVDHARFLGGGERRERAAGAFGNRADTAGGNLGWTELQYPAVGVGHRFHRWAAR